MPFDCEFVGPLLTPGFRAHGLSALCARLDLYPPEPFGEWQLLRRGLRDFADKGGPARVRRYVVSPLAAALGYNEIRREEPVVTRDGAEDGGFSLRTPAGSFLRAWAVDSEQDIDSPPERGVAMGFSPSRRASRILRARDERVGLITNGGTLKLLLCDPSGADSEVVVPLTGRNGWISQSDLPRSCRLVFALASPAGIAASSEIFDAARLYQASVTKSLRSQARAAIEDFLQCVLRHPENANAIPAAEVLWRQALTIVYRLLFILKLESSAEPGSGFGFAASGAWRRGLSPNRALGPLVRRHLDFGHGTGRLLEDGVRVLFQVCREGLSHAEISIAPLGGGLFDATATEALDRMRWGERAVALLLDRLLWSKPRGRQRERIHYGSLDVEELGRVYESLLDLEPAIADRPMVRVRRGRLETVMPAPPRGDADTAGIEEIDNGTFYLRTGLGRRASGSYYTPNEFVKYLVHSTLTPLVTPAIAGCEPKAIIAIKVFDPAMGSGHFLVEACRFLADALYEACCRCDISDIPQVRDRIDRLPDPDHRLASYLPRRAPDLASSGPSRARAMAICRRLVAVHCLYGTDRDPLAVELAKLSLWLESFAEGLPLTFLDHRLVAGDSISGPFFCDLACLPVGGHQLDPLLARGVTARLIELVRQAMRQVRELEASIGTSIADVTIKQEAKDRLDRILAPLRAIARAWSGAVATQAREANDAWLGLARSVADTGTLPAAWHPDQIALAHHGAAALPLDLTFPEVFLKEGGPRGFQAVLGNPPWDVVHYQTKEYLSRFDPQIMEAPTKREREAIERRLLRDPEVNQGFLRYKGEFVARKRLCDRLFPRTGSSGSVDLFQTFAERMLSCVSEGGAIGIIVPSSFHANEGTAHLRRKFLRDTSMECCFMFENRKKLFDIHGRQKFSLIVARRTGTTKALRCAFYIDSISQLSDPKRILTYDDEFIAATGGAFETLLELRGEDDLRVARNLFIGHRSLKNWMAQRNIIFGREAHMTDDAHRFTPIVNIGNAKALPLHEGKTFHQYTDRWKSGPRYAICLDAMYDKAGWLRASAHYRLAFREISRSTDERTMIAAVIPPGHVFGHKGTCERTPWERPDASALVLCAIFNSFTFDWCVRQKIAASVSLFMLHGCPSPELPDRTARFLAHGALRLSCRHSGYARLWREQLSSNLSTGNLGSDDELALRAAIDAVVARSFRLDRDDYRQILASFSHKVRPEHHARSIAAFDSLISVGEERFYRRHDPFLDVPLPTGLSQPAMDSPTASAILMPSIAADRMPPA